jgi:hypothetical protein
MATTVPAARAARLARLNARLTAVLDPLDALRTAPVDAEIELMRAALEAAEPPAVLGVVAGGSGRDR